jgi:hypothetical protein
MVPAVSVVLAVAVAAVSLSGCGPDGWKRSAVRAATAFQDALRARDGQAACAVLTDTTRDALESETGRSCAAAVMSLKADSAAAGAAEVWGTQARVTFGTDTVFLGRYADGWRVSAAGCKPGSGSYECDLEG